MGIVYKGKLTDLAAEVKEYKPIIDQTYRDILGEERARKLAEVAERVLVQDSFFNSVEEFNDIYGKRLPEKTSNKLIIIADAKDLKLTVEGRMKEKKIRTTPLFYISRDGFEHSGSSEFTERPIASYVHEYDHFIWYALQEHPLYLTNLLLKSFLDLDESNGMEGIEALMERVVKSEMPYEKKIEKAVLATYTQLLREAYEHSNRILDRMVLTKLGIDVPLPWRGQPRRGFPVYIATRKGFLIPTGGDMFARLSDREVIEKVLDWENNYNPTVQIPILENILHSFKEAKVSRVPITVF